MFSVPASARNLKLSYCYVEGWGGEGGWSLALPLPTSDNEDKTLMGTYFIIIIELVVLTYFIGNKLFK